MIFNFFSFELPIHKLRFLFFQTLVISFLICINFHIYRVDISKSITLAIKMKLKLLRMTFGYHQIRSLSISQASDLLTPNLPDHSVPQASLPSQLVFQFLPEMQSLCLSDEFLLKQTIQCSQKCTFSGNLALNLSFATKWSYHLVLVIQPYPRCHICKIGITISNIPQWSQD